VSQSRTPGDRARVVEALATSPDEGAQRIARLMASGEAGLLSR